MDASFSPPFFAPRNDDGVDENGSQKQQQQCSAGPSSTLAQSSQVPNKRKNRNPNPNDIEIIALSPTTITAKNRFVCEVCNKGFPREQNLQLHRRGHNLPSKLKQKSPKQVKRKLFLCPEITCPHHDPSQALGDLASIKKHFFRKHGEKIFSCEKCSKKYAVLSDYKAHAKTCGTKDYRCDCGTIFSRRDSYITHKTFCNALAKAPMKKTPNGSTHTISLSQHHHQSLPSPQQDMIRLGHPNPQCNTLMGPSFQSGPSTRHDLQMIPSLQSGPSIRNETLMSPSFVSGPSMHQHMLMSYFPDNGINNTNAMDSHHSGGFGDNLFNLFSSGNLMNEAAIQNPSTVHMSATALLQEATQFGSTSSTNIGATNPLLTFSETNQPESLNANNFGAFKANTTDLMNSVATGSSSSIFPDAYDEVFQNMDQFYHDSFSDNLAAFDSEGFDFGRLEPDEGLTREFFGIEHQVVNSGDGNVDLSSLDLQAVKTPDFGGPA